MDTLLTVREVAAHLRVDTATIRRWVAEGLLEAVLLPNTGKRRVYRIKKSTLEHVLKGE